MYVRILIRYNLVLKEMLKYYVKTPPLKKILQFQDRSCFFLNQKPQQTIILQQVAVGKKANLFLKRMLEPFLKIPRLKKIL